MLKADPTYQRHFGVGVFAAGEPGYASSEVDFLPARDTLAWSLAPVWGLSSSWGHTPIYSKRLDRYAQAANDAGTRFDLEAVTHLLTGSDPGVISAPLGSARARGRALILPNRDALPRVRLAGQVAYASDESDAATMLVKTR